MRALDTTIRALAIATIATIATTAACGPADAIDEHENVDLDTGASKTAPPEAAPPKPGKLTFARDATERTHGVHIHDGPHDQPKVIYSIRLPKLSKDEQLRLRAEVTLSSCNPKDVAGESGDSDVTPCFSHDMRQHPYSYAPRFSASFQLGNSPKVASGQRVSEWYDTRCPQSQHHCALAVPEVSVKNLPDAEEKYLNLVVTADADGHGAKSWHVMEVEQHKGALTVTRLGAGVSGAYVEEADSKNLISAGSMGVDRPKEDGDKTQVRRLLYQVELNGLAAGDVVDTDARMRAYLGNYGCNPLITGEIVLTNDKDGWKKQDGYDERLTLKNGRNCSNHTKEGCEYQRSGAVQLDKGTPHRLYASYVTTALRSCAAANGSDKWWVDENYGALRVNVRR